MISCTIILLKFRSKTALEKLRTVQLILRKGVWWFQRWLMGIKVFKDIYSNKHWAAKDRELKGCLLAIRKFWTRRRGLYLTFFSALLLPVIFMDACITTCTIGQCRWWFRWPAYNSSGSAFSLNCHLSFHFFFLRFNTAFMWKSVWTYSVPTTNVISLWNTYNIAVGMNVTQSTIHFPYY